MIVFEPDPPFIRWHTIENEYLSQGKLIFNASCFEEIGRRISNMKGIDDITFGYLLPNGGEEIVSPVSVLTGKLLAGMEKCVKLLPEHNNIIYKAANYMSARFAGSTHVLFCDTSFFIGLPKKACTYAIPYKLRKKGIRRYGGYGLCHQWAWEEARRTFGKNVRKVVSVYLGNTTNISAIKDGTPVETTIGFTSIEGIPSLNACGDIDPTIIFQLHADGMSFDRINDLLSKGSGLASLSDKAGEVLQYHIIRYIGAFISTLGGADAIVFVTEDVKASKKIILRTCHLLDFLGFKSRIKTAKMTGGMVISGRNSKIKGLCLQYDKWKVLNKKTISIAGKEA